MTGVSPAALDDAARELGISLPPDRDEALRQASDFATFLRRMKAEGTFRRE
jgi:hypothetical protein